MKTILLFITIFGWSGTANCQSTFGQRLSYTTKLTLQGFSLPFKNNHFNIHNLGVSIGVDYAYNKPQTLVQMLSVGFFNNRQHGTSFFVNTQVAYRPLLFKHLEPGVSLGIGRLFSFANKKNPYYEQQDGSWTKSDRQYTSHWQVPVGLSLGYKMQGPNKSIITPFIGYEGTAIIRYNNAFTVLPYTTVAIGTRIQFLNN